VEENIYWKIISRYTGVLYAYTCLNRELFVGDIVLLKDPEKSDDLIVRRLAAVEGYEIVSTDEKDEPFVLDKDQCWVVADNQALKAKVWVFWYIIMLACFDQGVFVA
jgi:hypothetical protein